MSLYQIYDGFTNQYISTGNHGITHALQERGNRYYYWKLKREKMSDAEKKQSDLLNYEENQLFLDKFNEDIAIEDMKKNFEEITKTNRIYSDKYTEWRRNVIENAAQIYRPYRERLLREMEASRMIIEKAEIERERAQNEREMKEQKERVQREIERKQAEIKIKEQKEREIKEQKERAWEKEWESRADGSMKNALEMIELSKAAREMKEQKEIEMEAQKKREMKEQKEREMEAQKKIEMEAQKKIEMEAQKKREMKEQKKREMEAQKEQEEKEQEEKEQERKKTGGRVPE